VEWPRGEAQDCKSCYTGSNPVSTSIFLNAKSLNLYLGIILEYPNGVAEKDPKRASYFPAIEKKHGQPMSFWFDQMANIADHKYLEQMAFLKENHGFSQAHANALVMYAKGSKSSHQFDTVADYFAQFDDVRTQTAQAIFKAITSKYPMMELIIAWNQPMLRIDGQYIFGVTILKNHLLMAPWSKNVLEKFAPRLEGFEVNKKTIRIPVDWKVDPKLLQDMAKARLAEVVN
jgi:uncharacterized protein YdhG (YjbR/CyaY superfamily)